jgi:hypothetical protein
LKQGAVLDFSEDQTGIQIFALFSVSTNEEQISLGGKVWWNTEFLGDMQESKVPLPSHSNLAVPSLIFFGEVCHTNIIPCNV